VFRRILVAMDGSDAARSAFVFVSDWARQFDSRVWFIQLTHESSRRRCEIVTDVGQKGRQLANHFAVSGATKAVRNQRLVSGIAQAAETFRADLIVLGFEPGRIAHQRLSRSVREQLTEATDVPVLIAPPRNARERRHVDVRVRRPIALGPASYETAPLASMDRLVHV
jgi:nucleotide-binding universal stress UspA family protein